jgi:hypothetical protein
MVESGGPLKALMISFGQVDDGCRIAFIRAILDCGDQCFYSCCSKKSI